VLFFFFSQAQDPVGTCSLVFFRRLLVASIFSKSEGRPPPRASSFSLVFHPFSVSPWKCSWRDPQAACCVCPLTFSRRAIDGHLGSCRPKGCSAPPEKNRPKPVLFTFFHSLFSFLPKCFSMSFLFPRTTGFGAIPPFFQRGRSPLFCFRCFLCSW